jgi:hypothetical protein
MSDDEATAAGSQIRWSARWDSQSWRISLRQDGTWRATRTVRSPRGDTQVHTQTWPTPEPAWAWIRDAWLAETTASYHHCEQTLLAGIRQLSAGSPGFRPGSPLLRTRAEAARDRLYAQARWAGQAWLELTQAMPAQTAPCAIPAWLEYALDDLAHGDGRVPSLDTWLSAPRPSAPL